MLPLMFFVFYFACFVSAQNTGLIPPFLNATSSIRNATSSAGRTSSTLFTTGSASTTAFSTTRAFSTLSTSLTTNTTIPSPPTSTPLSCPTSNNTLYTAPSGQTFVIECSIDHSRGDLSSLSTPDLEACIAACDATDECLDVTLSGTACYLKSLLGASIPSPGLLGARLLGASTPMNCPESDGMNYTAPSGQTFQIECGVDYAGGDMGRLYLDDIVGELWLENCIETCGNMTGCVDVSLSGSACYLKSTLGARLLNNDISSARLLTPVEEEEEEVCDTLSPTCPACNNTILYSLDSEPSKSFVIECGIDRPGGDMKSQVNEHTGLKGLRAFRNCLEDCAEVEGCVDVSLLGHVCYLKDVLQKAVSQEQVWGARLLE